MKSFFTWNSFIYTDHSETAEMVLGGLLPKPFLEDANPKTVITILKLQKPSKMKFVTLSPNLRHKLSALFPTRSVLLFYKETRRLKTKINAIQICIKTYICER